MRFRYFHFYSFDNDDMKSSKRHVILLSLIFLLKFPTRHKKTSPASAGIVPSVALPSELVVCEYGGTGCDNVIVKGTNECCAASTKDTNDGSENNVFSLV